MTESNRSPAPREPLRLDLEDIRCWLLEQIDGGEEVKGHDSMLSTYINTIDNALAALSSEMGTIPDAERKKVMDAQLASMPSVNPAEEYAHRNPLGGVARVFESMALRIRAGEPYADVLEDYGYQQIHGLGGVQSGATTIAESATVEPRGCPTPGSCSAVEELADLKQRLLPQANGRAERAEKARQMAVAERDEMLEKLRAATSMPCAPSATAATDRPDWAQQLPGAEIFDRAAQSDHGYDRSASLNEGRYVCTCGACSHYDAGER